MEPPLNTDWLEEVERRQLSTKELESLRSQLRHRPAELRRLEEEMALNKALASQRSPVVASNFTALVMAEIDRTPTPSRAWFQLRMLSLRWSPVAITASVLLVAGVGWNQVRVQQRDKVAHTAATIYMSANVPGMETLRDFDAIQALDTTATTPDDVALIGALRQIEQ
ncbi:MAG TPA: hypothetical protein VMF06_14640 [Candidatus Limnocylindria bacterium]|jgi:hypothetical protein|nr:hypothetical protein [Candidatus Limnocylindria bacterium]